jgi:hypothetical protein
MASGQHSADTVCKIASRRLRACEYGAGSLPEQNVVRAEAVEPSRAA